MRFHKDGTYPTGNALLVFGSNHSGRHGKGAALLARTKFGAIYGRAEGVQGQSYALPTKDRYFQRLSIAAIKQNIKKFKQVVNANPELRWFVTRVACGEAGYTDAQIAPLFAGIKHCSFAEEWRPYLEKTK